MSTRSHKKDSITWNLGKCLLILSFLAVIGGCAPNLYWQGLRNIEEKNYEAAIRSLRRAELDHPQDFKIKRELGFAYFMSGQFDKAIEALAAAQHLNPTDGKVIFYLGVSYELSGDLANAILQYKAYTRVGRLSHFRKSIERRLKRIIVEKLEQEIRHALATEDSIDITDIPSNSLAVLYFRHLGKSETSVALMKGLAEILAIDLSKIDRLRLIERIKLQKLLDELKFSQSKWVDSATAPRMGKLLGAARVITGSFVTLGETSVRIDAAINDIATGTIVPIKNVSGDLKDLLLLEKELVFLIIDDLGIELSWQERQEIKKMPTESLLAFISYSQGLEFEDQGRLEDARQAYEKALQTDPRFSLAETQLSSVTERIEAKASPPPTLPQLLVSYQEMAGDGIDEQDRLDRLVRASESAQLGQSVIGDNDAREPLSEATGADRPFTNIRPGRVKINIQLPE